MAYNYDALYRETPHALGEPTDVIVAAFQALSDQHRDVLDIGCGQGRDALFIARLGHNVLGVDLSETGVASMVSDADAEGLNIRGIAIDIMEFTTGEMFDVLLVDRTLHMLTAQEQSNVLARLLTYVRNSGRILIADERSNMARFRDVIDADTRSWEAIKADCGYLFLRQID